MICSVCGRQDPLRSLPNAATDNTGQDSSRGLPGEAGINEHSNGSVARENARLTSSRIPSGAGFQTNASNSIAGQGEINEIF